MLARTLVFFLLLGSLASAQHPFGWEDLFGMVRLSDPRPSPDGKFVLYTRRKFDLKANNSTSHLALVGRGILTEGSNGRWLPDGSILFGFKGEVRKWRGGKITTVLKLPVEIEGFEVSPDGKKLLFWALVFPSARTLSDSAVRLKSKPGGELYDHLMVRHWDSVRDGRRLHPFLVTLGSSSAPVDLLRGLDQDANGGGDWSPDSRSVAFVSKPSAGEAWTTNWDVYLYSDGKLTNLTADNLATDGGPAFSPDGKTLAYLAMDRPGYESDRQHIVLLDRATGQKRTLAGDWDRSVWSVVWGREALYAVAEEEARVKIFRVSDLQPVVGEGSNQDLQVAPDGDLIYLHSSFTQPAEVFSLRRGQLTRVNDLARVRMSRPDEFWVEHDGFRLHGWAFKPVGFAEGRKYPAALLIHGGPQGSWSDSFGYRWNPQFFAGAGYGVVLVDPRGASSYGMKFQDAIRGDWGPGPYSDLMAGLNFALREYPWLDQDRMAALGPSYGGYMINWIAGQDHPFRCLVNHDGLFSTVSAGYDTDELWFPEWEFGGTPWASREVYERNNPERFVDRWKTPMLVIHGGKDYRVTPSQGLSTFAVLQRRGIPSRLLFFPDEGHWVLKPKNSRQWHQTIKAWLDEWTASD